MIAVPLAAALGAEVTLLRVAESEAETVGARDYLDAVAARLGSTGQVRTQLASGRPAEGILDAAEASGADLIALTTHGRGGIGRWLTGTTTDRVLQGTHRALLVIRGHDGEHHNHNP